VILRPRLALAGGQLGRRAHLVGLQPVQQIVLAIEHAEMWAEKLVLRITTHTNCLCSLPGSYSVSKSSTSDSAALCKTASSYRHNKDERSFATPVFVIPSTKCYALSQAPWATASNAAACSQGAAQLLTAPASTCGIVSAIALRIAFTCSDVLKT